MLSDSDRYLLTGFSYVLACKYLSERLGETPQYWSLRISSEAMQIFRDPQITPELINRYCAEVLNSGGKLN